MTRNNGRFALNFEIIQGSFDLFYSLIEFSRHLMSIIQIRTTNTCSSAPKWLEKMYMFPWGACLGPMERIQPSRRPGLATNIANLGF